MYSYLKCVKSKKCQSSSPFQYSSPVIRHYLLRLLLKSIKHFLTYRMLRYGVQETESQQDMRDYRAKFTDGGNMIAQASQV